MGGQLEIGPSSFRSSGPPGFRIEAARGPVRISPSALRPPLRPQATTSPSFRISETRPSINTHSSFARRGESPRVRARAGLETRLTLHKPPSLEAPILRAHTSLVHSGSRAGLEADSNASLKPAVLRGREFSRQNIQNYDFQAPFREESLSSRPHPSPLPRGEGDQGRGILNAAGNRVERTTDYRLPSTETQPKPTIQENKEGQRGVSAHKLNIQPEKSQIPNTEHKKYPISKDKLSKFIEQSWLPAILPEVSRPRVLEAAVNLSTVYPPEARLALGGGLPSTVRRIFVESAPTVIARSRATKQSEQNSEIATLPLVARNDRLLDSGVAALPGMTELSVLRIVTGAGAREILMTGETAYAQRIFEATQATKLQGMTEAAKSMQALPGLTIEAKRAIQTPELQPALNPLEKPQLIKTYQALLPALGHERALDLVGQAVEKRVRMLNPEQKLALAEKIIGETEPETLLKGLPEGERWRVEIFVKKIVNERRTRKIIEIDQEVQNDRERAIAGAWDRKFPRGDEVISGAELIEEFNPLKPSEILPPGIEDGRIDQFEYSLVPMELRKEDLPAVQAMSSEHSPLHLVEEEEVQTREATAEEIHELFYEQIGGLDGIIKFAHQRAMVMLAGLQV